MQVTDEMQTVLLVRVRDRLGVAACAESMPGSLELRSKLTEVVDLAVEHDDDAAVFVVDRLVAGLEVDNTQALNAQANPRLKVDTP